jgi:iron complex transport system substrate-binding protein
MKKYIKYVSLLMAVLICLSMIFTGCEGNNKTDINSGPEESGKPQFIKNETESQITVIDPLNNEVILDKRPKRVVILMNSILDLWYLAGGTAVARVTGEENVPPEAEDIETVGGFGSPNIERIITLKPDLVIMSSSISAHRELKDIFEQNKIKYLYLDYKLYEDFINYLDLFTRITGREDIFKTKISEIRNKVNETVQKVSLDNKPKVLILFATTKSVQCELPSSLVGDMVRMLGADNIVEDSPVKGATKVEFSMERIVERDPDVILITTMSDVEKCKARIKEDIKSNKAWVGLRAVKEGNVHYLPKKLYIYKPNARYPEAIENLAKILYPGVFEK